MPKANERSIAKAKGLKRYFTGKPCKQGHISERFVTGMCVACNKKQYAEWASLRSSKDKINARRKAQRAAKAEPKVRVTAEHKRAVKRAYYKLHRERLRKRSNLYYLHGPANPKDTKQWLKRAIKINLAVRRLLKSSNPDLSLLRSLGLNL